MKGNLLILPTHTTPPTAQFARRPPTPLSDEGLKFIQDNYGILEFTVEFASTTHPSLLLYYGSFDKWNEVYTSTDNCLERYESASTRVDLKLRGSVVKEVNEVTELSFVGREMTRAKGHVYFTSNTPQWFFLAISNCHPQSNNADAERCANTGYCQGPTIAKMEYSFTNGSDMDRKHFSYDVFGLRIMYIIFFTAQVILTVVCRVVRNALSQLNKYHVTVQLLVISVTLTAVSYLISVVAYEEMAQKGLEHNELHTAASFLFNMADLLMVYLLVFLGKGWTLVRYKISSGGRLKLTVLMTFTFFSSIALDAWKTNGYDTATVVFFYSTPPGVCFMWLRTVAALWFYYCCWTTQNSFQTKRNFFFRFKIFFTSWLLMRPTICLACMYGLDDHER